MTWRDTDQKNPPKIGRSGRRVGRAGYFLGVLMADICRSAFQILCDFCRISSGFLFLFSCMGTEREWTWVGCISAGTGFFCADGVRNKKNGRPKFTRSCRASGNGIGLYIQSGDAHGYRGVVGLLFITVSATCCLMLSYHTMESIVGSETFDHGGVRTFHRSSSAPA